MIGDIHDLEPIGSIMVRVFAEIVNALIDTQACRARGNAPRHRLSRDQSPSRAGAQSSVTKSVSATTQSKRPRFWLNQARCFEHTLHASGGSL
jgi:hypothetical protein